MSRTIWKFPIKITDVQEINIPISHRFLHVDMQAADLCLWAEVNTQSELITVRIYVFGTGNPMPHHNITYLGSAQDHHFVWHVYKE